MGDAPIEPQDYIGGVKVIDIGDLRVARGKSRRPIALCKHLNQTYDQNERRIWCSDCESAIESFDAYLVLIQYMDSGLKHLDRRSQEIADAEKSSLVSRAAKKIDEAWRRQNTAPCCPHCAEALLPQDVLEGFRSINKEWALAKRKKEDSK